MFAVIRTAERPEKVPTRLALEEVNLATVQFLISNRGSVVECFNSPRELQLPAKQLEHRPRHVGTRRLPHGGWFVSKPV